MSRAWIGVDLDGTLATYEHWEGIDHIGEPIAPVVAFVKEALAAGLEVRVVTARVGEGPEAIPPIEKWCEEHIGQVLPVTDRKDFSMLFLVDDRVVAVEPNTGRFLSPLPGQA